MNLIVDIARILLNVVWWIIIYNDMVRMIWEALQKMTEPLYRPIRKIMPDFGALDLSPMVVLLGLIIVDRVLLEIPV
jgi:YggT family protein